MLIWPLRPSSQPQLRSINKSADTAALLSVWLPLITTYLGLMGNSLACVKPRRGGGRFFFNVFWGKSCKYPSLCLL